MAVLKKRPPKKPSGRDRMRAMLSLVEPEPPAQASEPVAADEPVGPIDPLFAHDTLGEDRPYHPDVSLDVP